LLDKDSYYHQINPVLSIDTPAMKKACRILERAEITTCDLLYRGSNRVYIIGLVNDGLGIKAIYKPRRGETPLYDFPDGSLYKREYAAFLMSQALEWFLVPPTIIRNGPLGTGSVQWFIDPKKRTEMNSPIEIDLFKLQQVVLFDYLVNNADRKASHFLEGRDGHLWVVDHGLTFNAVPKLRTVLWDFSGQDIPEKLMSDTVALQEKLRKKPLRDVLYPLLEKSEIKALESRIAKIIEDPVFPYPRSYRSVPWPWI
jgi:hypothetical protein